MYFWSLPRNVLVFSYFIFPRTELHEIHVLQQDSCNKSSRNGVCISDIELVYDSILLILQYDSCDGVIKSNQYIVLYISISTIISIFNVIQTLIAVFTLW